MPCGTRSFLRSCCLPAIGRISCAIVAVAFAQLDTSDDIGELVPALDVGALAGDAGPPIESSTARLKRNATLLQRNTMQVAAFLRQLVANEPLSEDGYQRLVDLRSDDAMKEYIQRLLAQKGLQVLDEGSLNGFVPHYSGSVASQSFARLEDELIRVPWVGLADPQEQPLESFADQGTAGEPSDPLPVKATQSQQQQRYPLDGITMEGGLGDVPGRVRRTADYTRLRHSAHDAIAAVKAAEADNDAVDAGQSSGIAKFAAMSPGEAGGAATSKAESGEEDLDFGLNQSAQVSRASAELLDMVSQWKRSTHLGVLPAPATQTRVTRVCPESIVYLRMQPRQ